MIYQNDEDYCRGAGYPDEEEAEQALCEALHGLRLLPAGRPRRWRGAARPLPKLKKDAATRAATAATSREE